jgi:hypothetical protein
MKDSRDSQLLSQILRLPHRCYQPIGDQVEITVRQQVTGGSTTVSDSDPQTCFTLLLTSAGCLDSISDAMS